LRDGLLVPDRKGKITVSLVSQSFTDKEMAGHLAQSRQDSLIGDTAGFNLAFDHFFALTIEFCRFFFYHARHPEKLSGHIL
jgi:hypothetical protein